MLIYFSTNDVYYSKIFRWLFNEPSSHVGLGFFRDQESVVVDCTKPCGREHSLSRWIFKYKITHSLKIPLSEEREEDFYQIAKEYSVGKKYDFSAYYWGLFCGLAFKLFRIPLPKKNVFQQEEHGLCTEIFVPFKEKLLEFGIDILELDMSATTPHMLALRLYEQTKDNTGVRWYGFDN